MMLPRNVQLFEVLHASNEAFRMLAIEVVALQVDAFELATLAHIAQADTALAVEVAIGQIEHRQGPRLEQRHCDRHETDLPEGVLAQRQGLDTCLHHGFDDTLQPVDGQHALIELEAFEVALRGLLDTIAQGLGPRIAKLRVREIQFLQGTNLGQSIDELVRIYDIAAQDEMCQ
jgi:hypothetical protein